MIAADADASPALSIGKRDLQRQQASVSPLIARTRAAPYRAGLLRQVCKQAAQFSQIVSRLAKALDRKAVSKPEARR